MRKLSLLTLFAAIMLIISPIPGTSQGQGKGKEKSEQAKEKKGNKPEKEKSEKEDEESEEDEVKDKMKEKGAKTDSMKKEKKEKEIKAMSDSAEGNAYGRSKGELSGKEFGKLRSEEAKEKLRLNVQNWSLKLKKAKLLLNHQRRKLLRLK